MRRTTKTDLERLVALRRAALERETTRAEPFAHGTAFFTPEHPTKWDVNLLLVDDATGLTAEGLIAEAERLQGPAGLRHRKVEAALGGEPLAPGFRAAGWAVEDLVLMMLRPDADRRGETRAATVREVGFESVRPLTERWYRETMSPAETRALADADAASAASVGSRGFLAEREGEPAAYSLLARHDGGIADVEHVYTAPEHRGHGLASAVVRAAVAAAQAAGDDRIMIVADAEDWPQRLYERLGFETVGRRYGFTRKPPQ